MPNCSKQRRYGELKYRNPANLAKRMAEVNNGSSSSACRRKSSCAGSKRPESADQINCPSAGPAGKPEARPATSASGARKAAQSPLISLQ
jgi:hypothetical protein